MRRSEWKVIPSGSGGLSSRASTSLARPMAEYRDSSADAVAVAWLVAETAGEDEIVGPAPRRGNLVFPEQLDQLSGRGRSGALPAAVLEAATTRFSLREVEVTPSQVRQL